MRIELKPIGIIHSPYKAKEEIPCQGYKSNKTGTITIFKEYADGLRDIGGFSYIWIFYYFHKAEKYKPFVKPFLDNNKHGLFATRYFNRPNPIGISLVRLIKRKDNILTVKEIDVLDRTPLLDIKPYVPEFDNRKNVKIGWLEGKIKR
jgi:tRNA-Thr(GGU) m(6)t(6)A37 methyltransferase TsaA